MKKNSLTTAVVAGIAGVAGLANVATAVNLNPDGLGQVMLFPYYTVNAGNSTLVSVVNTTDAVKAVKVRFLEAKNSREVLDFNLYLSPFDVWTAAIGTADGFQNARLFTNDTSCTVPTLTATDPLDGGPGIGFRNFAYAGTGLNSDDGENDLGRTREGHIEMIEMGELENDADNGNTVNHAGAAIHGANGVPSNCNLLVQSWSGNLSGTNNWTDFPENDFRGPRGGLFAGAIIVDVANGSSFAYNADAIDGFYTLDNADLHTNPGNVLPSLSNAQTAPGEADSIIFDNGALVTLDWATGIPNAVSSIYMHDNVYNEYHTVDGFSATEWVMTFPTKRLHIESATAGARLPFANDSNGSGDGLQFDASGYCEPITIDYYDREERETGVLPGSVDFSPPPEGVEQPGLNLCWEANVITFNQEAEVTAGESSVLGSRFARNINLLDVDNSVFTVGWLAMAIGNDNNFMVDGDLADTVNPHNQLFGLPLTGFAVSNFVNENAAPGVLANYSTVAKHRASRNIDGVTITGVDANGRPIGIAPSQFGAS